MRLEAVVDDFRRLADSTTTIQESSIGFMAFAIPVTGTWQLSTEPEILSRVDKNSR
jgi:hypothetical protein